MGNKATEQQLRFFADFIQKELGIIYDKDNFFQLEQRLDKISQSLGVGQIEDLYQKALLQGIRGDFKQLLLDTATNNETSFFRDPKVYQVLEHHILPKLKTNFPNSINFRIWCAAASFGQEPYSVAMLVHEFLKKNPSHPRIEVVATDIADHALKRCREAKYSQLEVQRGLSAQRLTQYFKKEEENYWSLSAEIRNRVDFRKQNLLDPFATLGNFHIVLCRYVLIYQDADRKKSILNKIEQALYPNGYLVLGASESAIGLVQALSHETMDGALVYKKAATP